MVSPQLRPTKTKNIIKEIGDLIGVAGIIDVDKAVGGVKITGDPENSDSYSLANAKYGSDKLHFTIEGNNLVANLAIDALKKLKKVPQEKDLSNILAKDCDDLFQDKA